MAQAPSQDERFRSMYAAHHGAVRDYCFRRLPPSEANDAVAEVFVVAWRRFERIPPGDATLPYLYGIARNVVANAMRAARRRGRLNGKVAAQGIEFAEAPEAQVVRRDEARRILDVLHQLSPVDQELLRLKAWERLSNGEIAEIMGLTLRAVDTRLTRARKKLARRSALPAALRPKAVRPSREDGGS